MVTVGVLGSIIAVAGGRVDIDLNHAVLLERKLPDVQTQFGWEAGKRRAYGQGRGYRLLPTTEIHVVEEQGSLVCVVSHSLVCICRVRWF
jgi:hypothetical protein